VPWPFHVTGTARRLARGYIAGRLAVLEAALVQRSVCCREHSASWRELAREVADLKSSHTVRTGKFWRRIFFAFALVALAVTLTAMGAPWTETVGAVGAAASKNPGTFLAGLGHIWRSLDLIAGASDAVFFIGIAASVILVWHAWSWRTVRLVMNHYPARPGWRTGVTRRWQHIRRDGVFVLEDSVFAATEARQPTEIPWDLLPRFAFLTGIFGAASLSELTMRSHDMLLGNLVSSMVIYGVIISVVVFVLRRRIIAAQGSVFELPDHLLIPARLRRPGAVSPVSIVLDAGGVTVQDDAGARVGPWDARSVAIDRMRLAVRLGCIDGTALPLVLRRWYGSPMIGMLLIAYGGLILTFSPVFATPMIVIGAVNLVRRWICRHEVREARTNMIRIDSWLRRYPFAGDLRSPRAAKGGPLVDC
jgi:hypothetical protein